MTDKIETPVFRSFIMATSENRGHEPLVKVTGRCVIDNEADIQSADLTTYMSSTFISYGTTVASNVTLGRGTVIFAESTLSSNIVTGEHVVIGRHVRLHEKVKIGDNCVIGDNVLINEQASLGSGVVITRNSAIGPRAVLMDNVTVGDGVTVGEEVVIHEGVIIPDSVIVPRSLVIKQISPGYLSLEPNNVAGCKFELHMGSGKFTFKQRLKDDYVIKNIRKLDDIAMDRLAIYVIDQGFVPVIANMTVSLAQDLANSYERPSVRVYEQKS